jgi:hypothetical protein
MSSFFVLVTARRLAAPGDRLERRSGCVEIPFTGSRAIAIRSRLTGTCRHMPIARAAGTKRVVLAHHVRNQRLADAIYLSAFAGLTASSGVRHYYDVHRAALDTHHLSLRAVDNRLGRPITPAAAVARDLALRSLATSSRPSQVSASLDRGSKLRRAGARWLSGRMFLVTWFIQ